MSDLLTIAAAPGAPLPTGVVTLVFTDIVDSSMLSERHGVAFEDCRAVHYAILRANLAEHHGREVHTAGDSHFSVFPHPADAIYWAIAVQQALLKYPWPAQIGPVRVRLGMYTGEPLQADNNGRPDYFGPAPNRAAPHRRCCARRPDTGVGIDTRACRFRGPEGRCTTGLSGRPSAQGNG